LAISYFLHYKIKKNKREKAKACKATQSYENDTFLGIGQLHHLSVFFYSPGGEALPAQLSRVYTSATQFVFLPSRFSFTQIDIFQLTHE
jgi:hypothetical protein